MSKQADKEREEARAKLLAFVNPGDKIYTILRHVSRSGMMRVIDLHAMRDGAPWWIGGLASTVLGNRFDDRRQGVKVGGCGMDMGFHLVYNLSYALFPTGFGCIGKGCPSNDHSNGDRDYTVHGASPTRCPAGHGVPCWCHGEPSAQGKLCTGCGCAPVSHWHKDGGYALRHRWL